MGLLATVNPIARVKGASLKEISIGRKQLKTPAYIPKIQKQFDFDLVCDGEMIESKLKALSFDIHTVAEVIRKRKESAEQFTVEMQSIDEDYDDLIKETPIIIDPNTEAFYYQIPWKNKGQEKLHVKDGILESVPFPPSLKAILRDADKEHYTQTWAKVINQDQMVSYISSYVSFEAEKKADIIVPPVPLITGQEITLDLMKIVNEKTARIVSERIMASSSMYLPLSYQVFSPSNEKGAKTRERILEYVRANIMGYRFLFIKILWYSSFRTRLAQEELGDFMMQIDFIKEDLKDSFALMLLDAGSEGYCMLANGVDCFSEPINGNIGVNLSGRDEESETPIHGRYLHPTQGWVGFSKLRDLVAKADGILPCSCEACDVYHGRLDETVPSIQWNKSRRAHAANLRTRQVDALVRGIKEGNPDDIVLRIDSGEDRNLINLVPRNRNRNNLY